MESDGVTDWLFLAYWLPREPSTPRISAWRKLRTLGAGQLADGLAALPRTARTSEHVMWVAQEIRDNGGTASTWFASPSESADAVGLVDQMEAAIDSEYSELSRRIDALVEEGSPGERLVAALRRDLQRIEARDYFRSPRGVLARAALARLTSVARPA